MKSLHYKSLTGQIKSLHYKSLSWTNEITSLADHIGGEVLHVTAFHNIQVNHRKSCDMLLGGLDSIVLHGSSTLGSNLQENVLTIQ